MFHSEKKCIFIHIPKTGGTTICRGLNPIGFESGGTRTFFKKNKYMGLNISVKHYPARFLKEYILEDDYFIFSFVRNPWDLLVSSYFWWNKPDTGKKFKKIKTKVCSMKFKDYILSEYVCYINEINTHGLGQHYWLLNEKQEYIVDFVGRCENIENDFNFICDEVGFERQELLKHNKSKHSHYTKYYDDETREIVAEKYAKDIEYFGYKFGE